MSIRIDIIRAYCAAMAALLLSWPAAAIDFTGAWTRTDKVCKHACTQEEPDPDFEIRMSIVLIQRGSVVCGLRDQNTLSDRIVTMPLRGTVVGASMELEQGEALFDGEPGYPFKVEDRSWFGLQRGKLAEGGARPFATYQREPFPASDQQRYLAQNAAFFDACFAQPASTQPNPGFDCANAATGIEALVCKTDSLAQLDRLLAQTYRAARLRIQGRDAAELKATQLEWLKGRDACWRADDRPQCARDRYETRIAELQARYALVPAFKTATFTCKGTADIVANFYNGEPRPSVKLVRGSQTVYGVLAPAASGARYIAEPGIVFWNKGDGSIVEWPRGAQSECQLRR